MLPKEHQATNDRNITGIRRLGAEKVSDQYLIKFRKHVIIVDSTCVFCIFTKHSLQMLINSNLTDYKINGFLP